MTSVRRRRTGRSLAALAGLLLTGCSGAGAHGAAPEPTSIDSSSTPSASAPTPSPRASTAPLQTVRVPAPAGLLRDASLPDPQRRVSLVVALGGLVTGQLPDGRMQVLYASVTLQQGTGGRLLVHLKLPYFSCPPGVDLRSLPRRACTGRTVVYADTDERSAVATLTADDRLVLRVDALTYRYGRGQDRGSRIALRPTGLRTHLELTVLPGRLLDHDTDGDTWRPVARVIAASSLTSASVVTATASQDDGYANRYTVVRRG